MKKGNTWRPPNQDYLDEEAAAAEWVQQNRDRWDPNFFIGPRQPISIRTLRRIRAPSPRERGLNRMERGFKHAISSMIVRGALLPGYVGDTLIIGMCDCLGSIADIVDETVVDDEKAGLLMEAIGYALDRMAGLGRMQGEHEPSCELRNAAMLRKKGGDNRATQLRTEARAKWDDEPMRLWEINQRDLLVEDPRRMTNEQVRDLILDEAADFIRDKKGKVASSGTVEVHIRRWRRAAGMSNANRRRT